jgi:hypothetical protein
MINMQARVENSLRAVQERFEATSAPSPEQAYGWALELVAELDEEVFAETLGYLFPKAEVATRALKERAASHLSELASRIHDRAADPELRRQAEDLRDRVQRFVALTSSDAQ